jgi:hypothetical protein
MKKRREERERARMSERKERKRKICKRKEGSILLTK